MVVLYGSRLHHFCGRSFPRGVPFPLSMNFNAIELPGRTEAVVVDDLAVADVHAGDALHFFCRQFKIKNI